MGSAGVQLAKAWGARVVALARRPEKAELARTQGADVVLTSTPATLRDDLARRRSAFARWIDPALLADVRMAALAAALGIHSLDARLYELPLAARKRLSWLWPLAGLTPWIMLDEPTIGQDAVTRVQLAAAVTQMCAFGYGVLFVTHDDIFAERIPHRRLMIGDMKVAMES